MISELGVSCWSASVAETMVTGCLIGNSSSTECLYETIGGGGGDQTHIILLGRVGKNEYAKGPQIMQ